MRERIQAITERLYDGIVTPGDWHVGLDLLSQSTQSALFHHVTWDARAQCVVAGLTNEELRIDKVREYEEHHALSDPRVPLVMQMPLGSLLLDHEVLTPRAMSRSPIYADWLVPLGLRHSLGVPVFDDGRLREWICIVRERDHRPYGEETQTLLTALMPDLLRASRLRTRMASVTAQAALGMAALEALPQALALVDASGQLRYANAAAQKVLAGGGGWRLRHGRIRAASPAVQERLERGIKIACGRAGVSTAASTLHAPPHLALGSVVDTLHVLPLHTAHPLARAYGERPHALLVWPHGQAARHAPELAAALGLTETEARLAMALAQGLSLKDFAQAQGCSWHTARTHIRNLMRKTGLHRQRDVAALVRG